MFNGNRLLLAIESKGMNHTAFAKEINVNRSTITRWISGKGNPPRPDSMIKISEVLGINIDWFLINNKLEPQSVEFFRSNVSTTKKARNVAKHKLFFTNEIKNNLSEWIDFPELNLPDSISLKEWEALDNDGIIELAIQCRKLWNLSNEPIINLMNILESNGIIVIYDKLGFEKMDGVSAWYNDTPYIYIASDKEVAVRSRFDLAHEVGHLIMHKFVPIEDYDEKDMYKKIEQQAHFFANELLYPSDVAISELINPSLEKFIQLKKKWKISIQAILRKTKDLKLITDDEYIKYYKAISYRKWRTKEPFDDIFPVEQPRLFKQVVNMLLTDGGFSRNDFLDKTYLSPETVELLLSLPTGILSKQEKRKIHLRLIK